VDFELLELRVARERQMLDPMVRISDTRGCRRQNLLRYFGDPDAPRSCTACDACSGSRVPAAEAVAAAKRKKIDAPPAAAEGPYDAAVYEKLRALRTELAREGKVPPYVVFHDATLRELARALPADERSFLAVKGAGASRWERYGARVVAITGEAAKAAPPAVEGEGVRERMDLPPRARLPKAPDVPPTARAQPTYPAAPEAEAPPWFATNAAAPADERLWTLCASGATLQQICADLARQPADVASQLADGAREGKRLDVQRLLGKARFDAIRAAAAGMDGDVVALRKRLPFSAALAEIRLALLEG
jgi:hypothetical protein